MKKILTKILLCLLVVCMAFGVTACSTASWQGTSMKNWGSNVTSNGGFLVETDNYVYYINGSTSYGDDNTFGAPVKGALMAVDKSTLGTDNVKTEVVVPKLFVASEYDAGVYIFGNYVYYGTPSTDMNNSGEIARGELTFFRTKLDGTDTTKYFTVDSLSHDYRMVEIDGVVYILYYENVTFSLKCYNTNTKTTTVIAKTDAETKGKYETLDTYYFLKGEGVNGLTLIYTTKVYIDDYNEEEVEGGTQREEETFNKVYAYKPGDTIEQGNEFYGKCILNGGADADADGIADNATTYAVTLFTDNYLFYNEKDERSKTNDYAIPVTAQGELDVANKTEVYNVEFLNETSLVESLTEIYSHVNVSATDDEESAEYYVLKLDVTSKSGVERVVDVGANVILIEKITHGADDYLYYLNSMSKLARQKIASAGAQEYNREEVLSADTVASAWYLPEFVEIASQGESCLYAMYLDNTANGASYVNYVKVYDSANPVEVLEEDTDDDDKIDTYYIEGQKLLGSMTMADKVKIAVNKLNSIPEVIEWEVKDGVLIAGEEIVEARKAYNELSAEGKKEYGDDNLTKLKTAEKALQATQVLYKLDGIENYYFQTDKQQEYRDAYNQAKVVMDTIDSIEDTEILELIDNNLKWAYYERAEEIFK